MRRVTARTFLGPSAVAHRTQSGNPFGQAQSGNPFEQQAQAGNPFAQAGNPFADAQAQNPFAQAQDPFTAAQGNPFAEQQHQQQGFGAPTGANPFEPQGQTTEVAAPASTGGELAPAPAQETAVGSFTPEITTPQPAVPLPGVNAPVPAQAQSPLDVVKLTSFSKHCNQISDCVTRADELRQQMRMQELGGDAGFGGGGAQIMTREGMDEYIDELKQTASEEIDAIVTTMKQDSSVIQAAPMQELRRTLYHAVTLNKKHWIQEQQYGTVMKGLSMEFLRRDYDGAMTADDVLFVSTHVVMSNYYNRQLWNRMETSLFRARTFDNIDISSVKGLSTKLFRSRKEAKAESLDVRRKILNAMSRRVGVLANDFELPAVLGILQCYTQHDLMPKHVEPLALRAINHISDFTPSECSALISILRRWGLMRLEVCEKLVERVCVSDQLTSQMAITSLLAIRTCFQRISEGGRDAVNSEPTKLKLRALGEQIAGRLDEVKFPRLSTILNCLDVIVQCKIYIPRKCLVNVFTTADEMIAIMCESGEMPDYNGRPSRPITAEEGRQLQAMLYHYGPDIHQVLADRLKQAFRDGSLPDEASVF